MIEHEAQVPLAHSGKRLDQVAQELFPDYSRARLQQWLRSGEMTLDGQTVKPKAKVRGGEKVVLRAEEAELGDWLAEDIALDVVFEDAHILVINKPPNLVVHPAAGHASGTLLNGLLHRWPELRQIPRCGIVHRLDKDTSGLMVVALTLQSQAALVEQLQARSVSRQYFALVHGHPAESGSVDAAIGRDPRDRKKMAVVPNGKPAATDYRVLGDFEGGSCLRIKLHTGRTHQIRVHMTHLGHPLIGDPTYNKRGNMRGKQAVDLAFARQALHAFQLGLVHPKTGQDMQWQIALPDDIVGLLGACQFEDMIGLQAALEAPWVAL